MRSHKLNSTLKLLTEKKKNFKRIVAVKVASTFSLNVSFFFFFFAFRSYFAERTSWQTETARGKPRGRERHRQSQKYRRRRRPAENGQHGGVDIVEEQHVALHGAVQRGDVHNRALRLVVVVATRKYTIYRSKSLQLLETIPQYISLSVHGINQSTNYNTDLSKDLCGRLLTACAK